jgi:5-methylcytosine-specific restriction endonuclease McrA
MTHVRNKKSSRTRGFQGNLADDIRDRDEGLCAYCGNRGGQIDHVLPYSRGGPTIRENGVVACHSCNVRKQGRLNVKYLTAGFYHLLQKGENLEWLDKLREHSLPGVRLPISTEEKLAELL